MSIEHFADYITVAINIYNSILMLPYLLYESYKNNKQFNLIIF
jgi:hypothetical protein